MSNSFYLKKILKDKRGIALFMAITVMAVFLFFLSASMFLTRIDSKVTSNNDGKAKSPALTPADASRLNNDYWHELIGEEVAARFLKLHDALYHTIYRIVKLRR